VSFEGILERSFVSEDVVVADPVGGVAAAARAAVYGCGGIDTGLGLLKGSVALATGLFDAGGCVLEVACIVCRSNSCPSITPPCDGATWLVSLSSGT
jgi:hypothetical protein